MKILVACEFSGILRDALIHQGHDAWSCDLLPSEGIHTNRHFQCDVRRVLNPPEGTMPFLMGEYHNPACWTMLYAFPPCTFLSSSGAQWYYHPEDKHLPYEERRPHPAYPDRKESQRKALEFVSYLLNAPIPYICLENPVGRISTAIRKPDQIIHPYEFGHDASKRTCLWLKNLPLLEGTKYIPPQIIKDGKYAGARRWGNQAPCGAEKSSPSEDRWMKRSKTFPGIAEAMAQQWTWERISNLPERRLL